MTYIFNLTVVNPRTGAVTRYYNQLLDCAAAVMNAAYNSGWDVYVDRLDGRRVMEKVH